MGMIRILVSLVWSVISIAGLLLGDKIIQSSKELLNRNLAMAHENLIIATDLLEESGDVLVTVENSLDTVRDAIVDVTFTLTDTRPLIDEASQIIAQDVPEAMDGVQASMPTLIETAAAVDETLTFLSALQLTVPNFFGADWTVGLGIDYDPEVPLDQALEELSRNLKDIPEDLRRMENDLNTASLNLLTLRDDLAVLADDLYAVNQQVEDLEPQLEALEENFLDMQVSLVELGEKSVDMLPTIRVFYMAFFSLILIGQVPSFYVGAMLLRGDNDDNDDNIEKEQSDEN